jgi:hypothetical protein
MTGAAISPLSRRLAPWLALTVLAVAWAVWREWAAHLDDDDGVALS